MSTKSNHERQVFEEFLGMAGLQVDSGSVRSEEPPRPDISCSIDGRRVLFELTRLADQQLANDVGHLLRSARRTGEGGVGRVRSYDDRQVLTEAVEAKARVDYFTDGCPLDLIVYVDGVFHALASWDFLRPTFAELSDKYRGRWNRMWLYDRPAKKVYTTGTK